MSSESENSDDDICSDDDIVQEMSSTVSPGLDDPNCDPYRSGDYI